METYKGQPLEDQLLLFGIDDGSRPDGAGNVRQNLLGQRFQSRADVLQPDTVSKPRYEGKNQTREGTNRQSPDFMFGVIIHHEHHVLDTESLRSETVDLIAKLVGVQGRQSPAWKQGQEKKGGRGRHERGIHGD